MVNTRSSKRKSPPARANNDAKKTSAKRSRRNIFSDDEELGSDPPLILVPPRDDDFNEKTWWMVDLAPVEESSPQGASALVKRCMRTYSWDETRSRKVLAAYRQFIMLKKNLQDWNANILSPCYLVDQMWHCHILDVVNYCHDMMLLCGHVVGHNPDGAMDYVAKQKRDDTTRASLDEHFGSYDEEIWNYSPDAASENLNNVANQLEGAAKAEEESESEAASPGVITIHMKSGEGGEAKSMLIVKRTIRMETVFNTFAASKKVTPSSLTFTLNGKSIDENKTLEGLGLKDDDIIDCLPTTIELRLKFYYDREFTVKLKRTDKMEEVFNNFVKTKKGYPASIYEINGNFIQRASTPESMRLNDNDLIRCRFRPLNNGLITIRLRHGPEETLYVLKRTSTMNAVFNAHADRKGICLDTLRFLIDGEHIWQDSSPADSELEDGDIIDCFLGQSGC